MIFFDEQQKLFHLKTKNTSYIFAVVNDAFFLHLYWGKRINTPITDPETFMTFSKHTTRTMSACDMKGLPYSSDVLPQEFPTFGNPDMRNPALHAVYPDGSRVTELRYISHEIFDGKKPIPGMPATYVENENEAQTLEVTLKDALTGMQVVLSYSVFEELDVITRSARVINGGNDKIRLRRLLSASVDFRRKDFDFIHLPGAWARERHPQRNPIFCGTQLVDSARGASSCQHNPFFALAEHDASEAHGDVYGFNLVYSGNFTAGVELDPYDTARAFIGINPFDFEHILEAGDTFYGPEAVIVYSDKGLGGMSRIYHKLYRTRLCRGKFRDIERYVLINNWEATYMNFNADKIVAIAEKAASVGVELMVLDDGWFGNRFDDHRALGDWVVNTDKLQGTLAELADRINALGMKFGLWFEPEMVSVDSDCYRAHPDWCIHVPGRERTETRQQLMLDLSRDDVCDFIIESVGNVLASANIEYVKWDYNRNMTNIGSALLDAEHQGELYHRYILGLYRVLETLTSRFPNVLFESCSSGGARFDPGMHYYMPQAWCSDDTDAAERAMIQYGTSLCYPYSTMGAHVSACPNHQVARTTPISARGLVAMPGQFGYELDLNKLTDNEIEEVKEQIKTYKKYGEVFHKGDLYRLLTPDVSPLVSNEFISEDGNTVLVSNFLLKAKPNDSIFYIKLQGLDGNATYRLTNTDKVYGGDLLMQNGIPYTPVGDYANELWIFEKV